MTETEKYAKQVAKDITKHMLAKYGAGWEHLSEQQKLNEIDAQMLAIFFMQQSNDIKEVKEWVRALRAAVRNAAGMAGF